MSVDNLPVLADPRELAARDVAEQIAVISEHAKAWLREAADMASVREVKARAAALEVYARQVKAGKQAAFDATEIVRRAERRQGQLQEEQRKRGERKKGRPKKSETPRQTRNFDAERDVAAADAMAQGTDEQFDQAIQRAKDDGKPPTRGRIKRDIQPDPVADAEAEAKKAQQRLRGEVRTLAGRVDKIAEMGDAPSSLALLLDAPESKAIEGLALDMWAKAAEEARVVLDRWTDQLTRAKERKS